ncbi:unnamed protein product [Discula destructiva]
MLEQTIRRSLLRRSHQPLSACLRCQWRAFHTTHPRLAGPKPEANKTPTEPAPSKEDVAVPAAQEKKTSLPSDPLATAPRSYGKRVDSFTPTLLYRPIGMHQPPRPGENTGIDTRTLKQRRDDFVNWEIHLKRREELKSQLARPYFRDWKNLDHHKGKTFLAPPRLFRHDKSLYFPNLFGQTLLKTTSLPYDTTPTLQGKASVVALFSSGWAEKQVLSFTSEKANPALHELLKAHKGRAQTVQVNVEDQTLLRYWTIRALAPWVRKTLPEEDWGKYFTVKAGISTEIRESIGLLNSKVGYVYLVDGDCKIRWAGSGLAEPQEVQSLTKGMATLMSEMDKGVWPATPK